MQTQLLNTFGLATLVFLGGTAGGFGSKLGSAALLTNGQFQCVVQDLPGTLVVIEASTTLLPGSWTNVGTVLLDSETATFTDAATAGIKHRFYRASDGTNRSGNAVGFIRLAVEPGHTFIANQLDAPPNTIASLLPQVPDGTQIYKHQANGYATSTFDSLCNCWIGTPETTLRPGEGAILRVSGPLTLQFVGEVRQGSLTNFVPAGFALRSSIVPQHGSISSDLGYSTSQDGDQVLLFPQTYATYVRDPFEPSGWTPSEPKPAVGESFFLFSRQAHAWVRDFSVWTGP